MSEKCFFGTGVYPVFNCPVENTALYMKGIRKIRREIRSETKQIAIRFGTTHILTKRCEYCDTDSEMFLPEIVSEFLAISTREIYRLIEAGEVHFLEVNKKQILVCVKSLMNFSGGDILQIGKEE